MRSRPVRSTVGVLGALLVVATVPTGSNAAPAPAKPVGVEITPDKVERDLSVRRASIRMLVVNRESTPRRVEMSVAGLGHDLDGTPSLLEPSSVSSAVRLGARRFLLAPAQRREIAVEASIPESARALYAAVIAEFSRLDTPAAQVETRSRVASLLLLRGPRPWNERVEVASVGLLPSRTGEPLRLYADVRNVGDVHVRPRGRMRILQGGNEIGSVPLEGGIILPGYARRFLGTWRPPAGLLPAARIEAVFAGPPARGSGEADLGRGGSAEPAARISQLRARVDERGPLVTLTLTNTGRIAISPTVEISALSGGFERARATLPQTSLAPGESRALEWRPALAAGVYVIVARATLGRRLLDQAVTALGVEAAGGGERAPARGRIAILAAVLLLVALALAWALAARRRAAARGDVSEP